MDRDEIVRRCKKAGFPMPIKYGRRYATVQIPYATIKRLLDAPMQRSQRFDDWCRGLGHAGVARFINDQLGTAYSLQDIYAMRRRGKHISSRILQLTKDYGEPTDPKHRQ
jgi:hypothetical protein